MSRKLTKEERRGLNDIGFLFLRRHFPEESTLKISHSIGQVLDISLIAPEYRVGLIQELRPRDRVVGRENTYHGNFGRSEYPLHTDLAHWRTPPRYIILRAITGDAGVFTNLVGPSLIQDLLPKEVMTKAIFATRGSRSSQLLPLEVAPQEPFTLRWDQIFISPKNDAAEVSASILRGTELSLKRKSICLRDCGDLLIIDNWRTLHGRSSVPEAARSRHIERTYLGDLHEIEE